MNAVEFEAGDGWCFGDVVMPWFGEIHNAAGVGGATVPLSEDRRVSVRTYTHQHPRELRMLGADSAVDLGDTVAIYAALVPRGS